MQTVTAGREAIDITPSADAAAVKRVHSLALLAVVVLVSMLATWLVSPRFAIESPSLVDDWAAVARAPDQAVDVIRFANPEPQRFRPSWIIWNYLQWHTLDAPSGLVGPNLWNLLRTFVLVLGVVLATSLAMIAPRTRTEAVVQAALAATPALLLVTIPKFARDLARFGVQEPLMLGGIGLGGALLVLAVQSLLAERQPPVWRTVLLGVAGSALWTLGVYQKEASLSVLPLLAAALFAGRSRFARWTLMSRGQRTALGAIGVVVVLPLAHVAIESARIVARGDLVYDAKVDAGRGILDGLETLYDWSHEVFSTHALRIGLASLLVAVGVSLARRRVDVLAFGALASAGLTLVFAAQTGVAVSRYYMPAYVLAAAALAISLSRLPTTAQVAGLTMLALVAASSVAAARAEVQLWTHEEQAGTALVEFVADAYATGCPVAVSGLDLETSEALPVLVAWKDGRRPGTCPGRERYLVERPIGDGTALADACAPKALQPLSEGFVASVYRCTRLRTKPVYDSEFGWVAPEELVKRRLLQPGLESALH